MRIGPRYKIARRLGAAVFEKTQNAKFAAKAEAKAMTRRRGRGPSPYAKELRELQKVRFTYGVTARQLKNYANEAIATKGGDAAALIFQRLERRLDSVALRAGFAPTRQAARQMSSHGHLTVAGRRVTVPSLAVSVGDVVAAREGSRASDAFRAATERAAEKREGGPAVPEWLKVDLAALSAEVAALPALVRGSTELDFDAVAQHFRK
ncbi:MAG TPA: 30S ribosomal protein S4 [Candidatus Paceibacterota bacterium]